MKKEFIPFLVVGDPSLEFSSKAVDTLIESGATLIELGVPYSDALADGAVIQQASERAARRVSLSDVLDFAAQARARHPGFRFVIFTYLNPILRMGYDAFAKRAQAAGVHAVLVVDLPPEEAGEYQQVMNTARVGTVFLASPTTAPARLPRIAEHSTAFIYYVSRTGVTGEQTSLSGSLAGEVAALRGATSRPVAVGFGISTPEQARTVADLGVGVVVGSAFVRIAGTAVGQAAEASALAKIGDLAKSLAAAIAESSPNLK